MSVTSGPRSWHSCKTWAGSIGCTAFAGRSAQAKRFQALVLRQDHLTEIEMDIVVIGVFGVLVLVTFGLLRLCELLGEKK